MNNDLSKNNFILLGLLSSILFFLLLHFEYLALRFGTLFRFFTLKIIDLLS